MSETTDEYLQYLRTYGGGLKDVGRFLSSVKLPHKNGSASSEPKTAKEKQKVKASFIKWRENNVKDFFDKYPFAFVGAQSDLCFFYNNDVLPYDLIDELCKEHPITGKNAKAAMEKAVSDGYLLEGTSGYILSAKGIKKIEEKGFKDTAYANLSREYKKEQSAAVVEKSSTKFIFSGKETDIAVFNVASEININDVCAELFAQGANNVADKVELLFKKFAKEDCVNLDDMGNCTITTKGMEFLRSDSLKDLIKRSEDEKGSGSFKTETIVGDVKRNDDFVFTSYMTCYDSYEDAKCDFEDFLNSLPQEQADSYRGAFEVAEKTGLKQSFKPKDSFIAVYNNGISPRVVYGLKQEWQSKGLIGSDGRLTANGKVAADGFRAADGAKKAKNATQGAAVTVKSSMKIVKAPIKAVKKAYDAVQNIILQKK